MNGQGQAMRAGNNGGPRPKGRPVRYVLPLLLAGLAVHLLLPQLTSLEHSLQVLRNMAFWAVGLAVGMQIMSYVGSGVLMRSLIALVGEHLSIWRGTLITTASYSIGLVAGGMVGSAASTYRWLRSSGVRSEGALLAGWLPGLFYTGSLVTVSVFGLLHLLVVHQLTTVQAVSFGTILLILVSLVALSVWALRHRARVTHLAERVGQRWAKVRRRSYDPAATQAGLRRLFDAWELLSKGGWRGPALGAILNVTFDMLTLLFVFVAAGHPVSPGVLLAGYGLPLLLGKLPLIPGGVGVVESSMAALYDSLGVPDGVTVVVILIYRLLSFWTPTLIGFPLIPLMQRISQVGRVGGEEDST
jgi:uncharacterized protein (TIRG00374 family)